MGRHEEILVMMDIFTILIVMMLLQVHAYIKTYQIAHFKYVYFIVCQLLFNKTVIKSQQ